MHLARSRAPRESGAGLLLLELLVPSVCPACDRPRGSGEPLLCEACLAGLRPLRQLAGVATALAYTGTARRLVQRFKFEGRRDALRVLLVALSARVDELEIDGIVPLPRHAARVRASGRDPVWLLARALARRSGLPVWDHALARTRPTPPQTGLRTAERHANVAQSFRSRADGLRDRRALLLDDVTTTGATLAEACVELRRRSGARAVVPLALAGTPPMESGPLAEL